MRWINIKTNDGNYLTINVNEIAFYGESGDKGVREIVKAGTNHCINVKESMEELDRLIQGRIL